MTRTHRVCAVVVTYNRSALLRECLDAVLGQSVDVDVVVVDNASTDDTPEVLTDYVGRVEVIRLPKNTGGAGGFHDGLAWALDHGSDWVWLMDDDTIARPDCLELLLAAADRSTVPVDVLASRVEWVDGRRHPMNGGVLDDRFEQAYQAAALGGVALRGASFVSVLISRRAALQHGLPMKDYFIWVDDLEYTMRITRDGLGVLVPESVAVHKTEYFELSGLTPRYYFHVRNWLWLLRFSPGVGDERRRLLLRHLNGVVRALRQPHSREVKVATLRGLRDGLLRRPDLSPLTAARQAVPPAA